jgi:hypothetical protein
VALSQSCKAVVLYRSCQAFIHGSAKLTAAPLARPSVRRTVELDQAGHPPPSITHNGAQTRLGYIITRTRPPCGRACQNELAPLKYEEQHPKSAVFCCVCCVCAHQPG